MAEDRNRYRVIVAPEASDGLRGIVEYLEKDVSLQTADYVRQSILDGIQSLAERRESYGIVHKLSDEGITYRRVLVLKGKYRIIYTIVETKTEVRVIDISHSNRGPAYMEEIKSRR